MSDHIEPTVSAPAAEHSRRGQSLVEFALVLPMLLTLLIGIADFGRVFHAGIAVEATARNAAETVAQEYLQLRRSAAPPTTDDFDRLHVVASETVCEEAEALPNKVESGGTCSMPATAACIHDFAAELVGYTQCGSGSTAAPPECAAMHATWSPTEPPTGSLAYVEVRVCYQFTTLIYADEIQLPLGWGISLGDIYIERTRIFTVADY